MFNSRKTTFIYILCVAATLLLFYRIRGVLLPFILGIIIAYFIKTPLQRLENSERMQKLGLTRGFWAALFVLAISFIVVVLAIFVIPIIFNQVISFIGDAVNLLNSLDTELLYGKFENVMKMLKVDDGDEIKKYFMSMSNYVIKYLANLANSLLSSSIGLVNTAGMLFITPITAFYFARDWSGFMNGIFAIIPLKWRKNSLQLFRKIDDVLQSYLLGQVTVIFMLSLYYAVILSIFGLKYGFAIGLFSGLLTFLPYIGSTVGMVMGLITGYFQFGFKIKKLIIIAVIFASGQFLEGNFVTPKLIGNRVKLHPLWVIFALFAGGSLFGFWGILLSLPVASVLGVIVRFYVEKRRQVILR